MRSVVLSAELIKSCSYPRYDRYVGIVEAPSYWEAHEALKDRFPYQANSDLTLIPVQVAGHEQNGMYSYVANVDPETMKGKKK
jgi:predicted metal-dependent hydrolase